MSPMPRFLRGFLCLGALSLPLSAEFAPPAEGPVPFRRDKLPVDVDTMASLSRQLVSLAGAMGVEEAEGRRHVAQMTALALALDPANRRARDLIAVLEKGGVPERVEEDDFGTARSGMWQALAWLEMPEAGPDGQALAACLGDVLAAIDPEHPKAKERDAESGAWKGWVPALAAYQPKVEAPREEVVPPEPVKEEPKGPALASVTTAFPLWYLDKDTGQRLCRAVELVMDAKVSEEPVVLLRTTDGRESDERPQEGNLLRKAMAGRLGELPPGFRLTLKFPRGRHYSTTENGRAITGAAAVLLDSAMKGKPPGAVVLAVVEADGSLSVPPGFWNALRELSDQPGMRLVVPKAAAEYLAGLLVLDDAAFFMKHEVLLAGDVDELCDLASGSPSESVALGLEGFAEIRRVGEGKALGAFVAHPSTQQRLGQVMSQLPAHASARLLALQGSGNRPRFLDRKILARELRAALEPLAYLDKRELTRVNPIRLDAIHEASRARLDKMPGYIDTRDRELHKQVVAAVDNLRTLSRTLRQNNPEKYTEIRTKQTAALKSAHAEYARLMSELTVAAGDRGEYPGPPPVVADPEES